MADAAIGAAEDISNEPVSFIIPCRSRADADELVASLSREQKEDFEIILVEGTNPAVQRNQAVQRAENEYLVFLDHDSIPVGSSISTGVTTLKSQDDVAAVGGPEGCCEHASLRCRLLNGVYRSAFALGRARARYAPTGDTRPASQKEIILSNLIVKKSALADIGGFNESLFPNEENELHTRLKEAGWEILYSPDLRVTSCKSESLTAFISRFFRYGRGRATQMHEERQLSPEYLLPSAFLIYLLSLAMATLGGGLSVLTAAPGLLYAGGAAATGIYTARRFGRSLYAASTLLYPLVHLSYGIGLLVGLVRPYQRTGSAKETLKIGEEPAEQ